MATRSTITARLSDGTYRSVYCHYDGYPEGPHGVGWKLQHHYNSQELAERVTSLGPLSFLEPSCDAPHGHTYETPVEGHTVAYCRDRGDSFESSLHSTGSTYENVLNTIGYQEYNYLWDGARWQLISDDPADVLRFTSCGGVPA